MSVKNYRDGDEAENATQNFLNESNASDMTLENAEMPFPGSDIVKRYPKIGYWALRDAASSGDVAMVKQLLSFSEVERNFEALLHALEAALDNGHQDIVKLLLVVANTEQD